MSRRGCSDVPISFFISADKVRSGLPYWHDVFFVFFTQYVNLIQDRFTNGNEGRCNVMENPSSLRNGPNGVRHAGEIGLVFTSGASWQIWMHSLTAHIPPHSVVGGAGFSEWPRERSSGYHQKQTLRGAIDNSAALPHADARAPLHHDRQDRAPLIASARTQLKTWLHLPHRTCDRLKVILHCERQRHYHARHNSSPSTRFLLACPHCPAANVTAVDGPIPSFHDDYARLSDRLVPRPSSSTTPYRSTPALHCHSLFPLLRTRNPRARLLQRERQRWYRARQATCPSMHTGACHSFPNLSPLLPPSHSTPCWSTVLP